MRTVIQMYVNPLVTWVWIGCIVMAMGTVVAILPDGRGARVRRRKRELDKLLSASERF